MNAGIVFAELQDVQNMFPFNDPIKSAMILQFDETIALTSTNTNKKRISSNALFYIAGSQGDIFDMVEPIIVPPCDLTNLNRTLLKLVLQSAKPNNLHNYDKWHAMVMKEWDNSSNEILVRNFLVPQKAGTSKSAYTKATSYGTDFLGLGTWTSEWLLEVLCYVMAQHLQRDSDSVKAAVLDLQSDAQYLLMLARIRNVQLAYLLLEDLEV